MKKILVVGLLLSLGWTELHAQILHTESFNVILDTAERVKGNFTPNFNFKNLKKDLFEFENTSDISVKIGKDAFTIANRVNLSKFGEETIQSGGFIYAEYRRSTSKRWLIEPYLQYHWAEIRGLDRKFAVGSNVRYRFYQTNKLGIFGGIGPFYEFERWNYEGVLEENRPMIIDPIENQNFRLGAYVSYKQELFSTIFIDFSFYYQNHIDSWFSDPRIGTSTRLSYQLTEYVDLALLYQSIYDPNPVVPIDKIFRDINFGISVSF
ncbi:DUF481 domain-containing protein [Luteibaculum oceani]|uniref:DUF481 domain-containing protein n=1 Tax=Luteibaculum oceani TaxID=1294296 RepID=A0A5C6UZQ3_9FLAO|nr:DUF481 domain-containing protein [Luteibaculum oceani]TXC76135.1 DUF481 domain-containing protein [Luteibaculum oceani]